MWRLNLVSAEPRSGLGSRDENSKEESGSTNKVNVDYDENHLVNVDSNQKKNQEKTQKMNQEENQENNEEKNDSKKDEISKMKTNL